MENSFLKPTKYKLLLFVIIMFVLYFLPVIPAVESVGITDAFHGYQWTFSSFSEMNTQMLESSIYSFGAFSGAVSNIMNSMYILVVGYLLACVFLYGYHKVSG